LMGFDIDTQREIVAGIATAAGRSESDGRDHDFVMYFNAQRLGVVFSVSRSRDAESWRNVEQHAAVKMYEEKCEQWIAVAVDLDESGAHKVDFKSYDKKWQYDADMEKYVKEYGRLKLGRSGRPARKVGRNQPCPCGSGLKYKRCCGRYV